MGNLEEVLGVILVDKGKVDLASIISFKHVFVAHDLRALEDALTVQVVKNTLPFLIRKRLYELCHIEFFKLHSEVRNEGVIVGDSDFIVALTFELIYKLLFELCFALITHLFSSFVSIISMMSVISQFSVLQIFTRTPTSTLSFLPSFASTFVEKPALRRNSVLLISKSMSFFQSLL